MIIIKTNIEEVLSSLKADLKSFEKGGKHHDGILRQIASTSLAEIRTRIHQQGKDSDNNDIGQYSTKPMYASVTEPIKLSGRPIGKTGKSRFTTGKKAGQDHKTRYFASGYKAYKTAAGRNVLGKVNLSLTGQMDKDFNIQPTEDGWGLGWINAEYVDRARRLEKHFRKEIYSLTTDEIEQVEQTANDYINAILKGTD